MERYQIYFTTYRNRATDLRDLRIEPDPPKSGPVPQ